MHRYIKTYRILLVEEKMNSCRAQGYYKSTTEKNQKICIRTLFKEIRHNSI